MANGIRKYTVVEGINVQLGQAGYKILEVGGTADTGDAVDGVEYVALTVLVAATITTASNDASMFPNLATLTVPAGTTIYGRWNKVTAATSGGFVIVYKG